MSKIKGVDVSQWQGGINWDAAKEDGVEFAIVRLGYRNRLDLYAPTNIEELRRLGIYTEVYWFVYWNGATIKENAEHTARFLEAAKLPKTTRVWCDLEYDSWDKAGETATKSKCTAKIREYIDELRKLGLNNVGIYTNADYYKNYIDWSQFQGVPVWLAYYEGEPPYPCEVHQATSKGKVRGIQGEVDIDYYIIEDGSTLGETTQEDKKMATVKNILDTARGWLGWSEHNGKWWNIVEGVYNNYIRNHRGEGRSYCLQRTDPWCDCFVSSVFIKSGAVDALGGVECGCPDHIQIFKNTGRWLGKTRPKAGDIIFFDWGGDGVSDHVGIVEAINGDTVTTIEGNKNDSVERRTLAWNSPTVYGYARPTYDAAETPQEPQEQTGEWKTKSGNPLNETKLYDAEVDCKNKIQVYQGPSAKNPKCKTFGPFGDGHRLEVLDEMANGWLFIRDPETDKRGFVSGAHVVRISPPTQTGAPSKTTKRTCTVTATTLAVRTWAGTENPTVSFSPLKKGEKIAICDTIKDSKGADWYYIKKDGKFGFCAAKYIK